MTLENLARQFILSARPLDMAIHVFLFAIQPLQSF
jgi:hypothetical protein